MKKIIISSSYFLLIFLSSHDINSQIHENENQSIVWFENTTETDPGNQNDTGDLEIEDTVAAPIAENLSILVLMGIWLGYCKMISKNSSVNIKK